MLTLSESAAADSGRSSDPHVTLPPPLPWAGVMHDVRGAATAIEALASLIRADVALGDGPGGVLSAIEARAQQLQALCDAVSLLQDRPSGRLPLSQILPSAVGRLQKLLALGCSTLKCPGEIPDTEWESRPLGVLIQSVLVTAVNARDPSRPAEAAIRTDVVNGETRILIDLPGEAWRAASEAVRALASEPAGSPMHAATARALARLGARLDVVGCPAGSTVVLSLPGDAP